MNCTPCSTAPRAGWSGLGLRGMGMLLACCPLASCDSSSLACPAGWLPASSAHFHACLKSGAFPVQVQTNLDWPLRLSDSRGAGIADAVIGVGGGMPIHHHGLPTAPQADATAQPGVYALQGLRFNMPGRWRVQLTISAGGVTEDLVFDVDADLPEPD